MLDIGSLADWLAAYCAGCSCSVAYLALAPSNMSRRKDASKRGGSDALDRVERKDSERDFSSALEATTTSNGTGGNTAAAAMNGNQQQQQQGLAYLDIGPPGTAAAVATNGTISTGNGGPSSGRSRKAGTTMGVDAPQMLTPRLTVSRRLSSAPGSAGGQMQPFLLSGYLDKKARWYVAIVCCCCFSALSLIVAFLRRSVSVAGSVIGQTNGPSDTSC